MHGGGMDAERGGAVRPNRRVGKLAVVVAVQNLLVVVCLLVTFYVYWDVQAWASEDIVHIRFDPIQVTSGNTTLQFLTVSSSYQMDVNDHRNQISIRCTGFYIWHVHVCSIRLDQDKDADEKDEAATLRLEVVGGDAPLGSFRLNATRQVVCRGLHSIIYLRKDQRASLHSSVTQGLKIKNVTVGLSYLQGRKCVF